MAAIADPARPKHPAKYSDPILDVLDRLVAVEALRLRRTYSRDRVCEVVDIMAGVGRVHRLARPNKVFTTGIEIEPEWAAYNWRTICADVREYAARPGTHERYDVLATSPDYGNRFSDHHDAKDGSERHSYRHYLGRMPTAGSTVTLPYGRAYCEAHASIVRAAEHMVRPGGLVLWNVSNFYRGPELVGVIEFHRGLWLAQGYTHDGPDRKVVTKRHTGNGATATQRRAAHEVVMRFRKPGGAGHAPA